MFVYLIALRAFGPRAALVAGIGMALSPLNALYASLLFPQVLFTFLLTVGVWFCGRQQGFWAGLFLGAAALTRSVLLPLILLAGLAGLLFRFRRATHLMLVLGALLMIAPWTVRNVVTQQTFIAIASMGWGANIFFGTFDPPYGGEKHIWELIDDEGTAKRIIATSSTLTEIEGRMFVEGLRRIADNPVGWLWTRVHQYPRLFLGTPSYLFPDAPIPRSIINAVYFTGGALFVALSALGLFMARGRWRCVYHIAAFPIFFAVAQFPALTDERFGLDMMPMMMVFAGFAVSELWRRLTMMRRKH